MSNTIGKLFRFTSFGESHGKAIGGVIDGCPAGLKIDMEIINHELARRRTASTDFSSSRKEADEVVFLSGVFNNVTLGTPIAFMVENKDAKSKDYDNLKDLYRPSHADYTYDQKYGIRDYRGGGRSSARETVARVVAGSIAQMFLKKYQIEITAFVSQIGEISVPEKIMFTKEEIDSNIVRCPDDFTATLMVAEIGRVKKEGDTLGGQITTFIMGVPAGLGEPVFGKLNAELGKAILSIPSVKGIEFGGGFTMMSKKGSEVNDLFVENDSEITTDTNWSGGIQGGISNGSEIFFRTAFKPVSTIFQEQQTVNKNKETVKYTPEGRHDVCVVPRAVPIVEAMAALVIADMLLLSKSNKID